MDDASIAGTTPTPAQDAVIERIMTGYRTIVAGASGTGRSTTILMAARAWNQNAIPVRKGTAFIVVADERRRSAMVMSPLHDGTFTYTFADVRRLQNPAGFLKRFGLVLIDDADLAHVGADDSVLDLILRHCDARVARFVASGQNDADATFVLTERFRQQDDTASKPAPTEEEQQERHVQWGHRLREIAREMRGVDFDMQALDELATAVEANATRCGELAS